jgi:hypothetical protein
MVTRRTALGILLAAPVIARASMAIAEPIRMRALYERDGSFSELAESLKNQRVVIRGFMAPPLKPMVTFFVLTQGPVEVCPFCDSEASWPRDIIFVRPKGRTAPRTGRPLLVSGILELGTETDPETGFVSRVRLVDAELVS